MLLAAVNFQLLTGFQVHKAGVALGFQDKIQLFLTILVEIHSPVGVVRADGGFNFESTGNLEEHLHIPDRLSACDEHHEIICEAASADFPDLANYDQLMEQIQAVINQ